MCIKQDFLLSQHKSRIHKQSLKRHASIIRFFTIKIQQITTYIFSRISNQQHVIKPPMSTTILSLRGCRMGTADRLINLSKCSTGQNGESQVWLTRKQNHWKWVGLRWNMRISVKKHNHILVQVYNQHGNILTEV